VERLDDVTGLGRLDDVTGSGETDRGRTKRRSTGRLGRLSFSFGSEQSRAWAGCGGPWAAIPPWWIVFCSENGVPRFVGTRHYVLAIFIFQTFRIKNLCARANSLSA
jgi:hypothetical protein